MNTNLPLSERYLRAKYPVARLLVPDGGILNGVVRVVGDHDSPDFEVAHSALGNLTAVFPHVHGLDSEDAWGESLGGAGSDVDCELAWLRAVMEGAERYASMAYSDDEFIVASGNELGAAALDLDTIPRCSAREYAHPKCPYVPADKSQPIRWVRAYSLFDRALRWVPAIMTHLYFQPAPQEMFWQMISTGIAAHTSFADALCSAICEVVERDAIAITWLARLPLPEIEVPQVPPFELAVNLERVRRCLVKHRGFDATTDLGVPTVYAVQTLDGHPHLSQYVNCVTEFDPVRAYAKTIREAAPARTVFEGGHGHPESVEDFQSLHDGAALLGKPQFRSDFGFLLDTGSRRALSDMRIDVAHDPASRLKYLVDRLRSLKLDTYVVDLTTTELREIGIWVVRAVIPGLMPTTATHMGRFLGHPRLYEYPKSAGFGALSEAQINPAPQPFA